MCVRVPAIWQEPSSDWRLGQAQGERTPSSGRAPDCREPSPLEWPVSAGALRAAVLRADLCSPQLVGWGQGTSEREGQTLLFPPVPELDQFCCFSVSQFAPALFF